MADTNPCEFLLGVVVCPRWFWVLFRFCVGSFFFLPSSRFVNVVATFGGRKRGPNSKPAE